MCSPKRSAMAPQSKSATDPSKTALARPRGCWKGPHSPRHRIRGDNIVPGDTADQGSYRSELSGLYGITMGAPIRPLTNSTRLIIKVPLRSGVTALPHWREDSIKPRTPRYQPNTLTGSWPAGSTAMLRANNKDDNRSIFLDRWALLLTIDMDLAAKVHWHLHAEH
jgi:hypothetical protein